MLQTVKLLLLLLLMLPAWANVAQTCHRGELDRPYCDANRDLLADVPRDHKALINPKTLVFTYTPVEDPVVYEKIFRPFTDYLSRCVERRVVFYEVQSNSAQIEAMRSGRLHVAGFSTGATPFAVNLAGAVPFAVAGLGDARKGYHLMLIVRKESSFHKMVDLKSKKVAHVSPSSNSGHIAPLSLFPKAGLVPARDYEIMFSGKHDASVLGVLGGSYDAAAVASDVFERMARRGDIHADHFRVLYRSDTFPTSSFAYAHNLEPALRDKMIGCFHDYRFGPELRTVFDDADRFLPITYAKDYEVVRSVSAMRGKPLNRSTLDRAK